jgi:predicted TIM-barrel enzyme
MNRGKILESWRKKIAAGTPIKGGNLGPEFYTTSHAAAPAALLPIGDANAISLNTTKTRVATAKDVPVLAGICGADPLRMMGNFLQEIKSAGAAGVQNCPSVGLIDGHFRKTIEDSRLGYDREVEMIGLASKLDLLTAAFAFNGEEARQMAEAGVDVVVAHPGFADKKDQARIVAEIAAAARSARKNVLVFGYGVQSNGLDGIQTD